MPIFDGGPAFADEPDSIDYFYYSWFIGGLSSKSI